MTKDTYPAKTLNRRNRRQQQSEENIQQVREAIKILEENDQKVTVAKIAGLTGLGKLTLYSYDILKPYIRTIAPRESFTKQKQENVQKVLKAIDILESNNQKVTVAKISKLTGIQKRTLYNYDIPNLHVRTDRIGESFANHSSPITTTSTCDCPHNEPLGDSVSGYVSYLEDNHFYHSESREDVKNEMLAEFSDFNVRTFNLAIEELLKSGALATNIALKGHYLKVRRPSVANATLASNEPEKMEQEQEVVPSLANLPPAHKRLVIIDQYGSRHEHDDDATIDQAVERILTAHAGLVLTIYKAVKVARNRVSIEEMTDN
ncbi:hypothetical protein AWB71_05254 [Caballeronia peredens]|nr:hypothetical protein AWB71_05254 [Caballeronia peredens]